MAADEATLLARPAKDRRLYIAGKGEPTIIMLSQLLKATKTGQAQG